MTLTKISFNSLLTLDNLKAPYQANTGSRSLILNILLYVVCVHLYCGIFYVNYNLYMAEKTKQKKKTKKYIALLFYTKVSLLSSQRVHFFNPFLLNVPFLHAQKTSKSLTL